MSASLELRLLFDIGCKRRNDWILSFVLFRISFCPKNVSAGIIAAVIAVTSSAIIMIALNTGEEEDEFDPWAFLDPFSRGVWIMVAVTVVASAALYYFFEILNEETDLNEKQLSVIESTWLFATAFAGEFTVTKCALRLSDY